MQLPVRRTRLGSAQGRGRVFVLCLSTALLLYSLIHGAAASRTPQIINPTNNSIIHKKGGGLSISCRAWTTFQKFHNVYWLVNGTFVEDAYPDGRVTEKTGEVTLGESSQNFTAVETLAFTTVQAEDFRSTFTCVVQDPAGADKKRFRLRAVGDQSVRLTLIRRKRDRDLDVRMMTSAQ